MANKVLIECKARDMKHKHAYMVDRHSMMESTLCKPDVETTYIDPRRVSYRSLTSGKECKKCFILLPLVIEKFAGNIEVVRLTGDEANRSRQLADEQVKVRR